MNDSNELTEFLIGEIINYHQAGKSYLSFDIKLGKSDVTNIVEADTNRLSKNAFAVFFRETGRSDVETNTQTGWKSGNYIEMMTICSGYCYLLPYFEKSTGERNTIANTIIKAFLKSDQGTAANKIKSTGILKLENSVGFC